MKIKFLIFVIGLGLFSACEKDEPVFIPNSIISELGDEKVWVVNEGGFQNGNASLSIITKDSESIQNNVFEQINNKKLGDIFQSVAFYGESAFLVINNSGKIEKVNRFNLEAEGTIEGLTSPRYFLAVSESKAYVTDLFEKAISIVNTQTYEITGKIKTSGWTETIKMYQGKIYVLNASKSMIYTLDAVNDVLSDSTEIGLPNPNSFEMDVDGNIWVLCGGESWNNINGGLVKVDGNLKKLATIPFSNLSSGSHLVKTLDGDSLYFLHEGLKKMGVNQTSIPSINYAETPTGVNFYSLGVQPRTGTIFLGDAVDFVQNGKVYQYSASGILKNEFESGINPGRFYFD